ncbi:MAG: hypothetical protein E7305_09210 [Butyrivibrio sp.]|nr:hypothetical protein [Butyrivibrio sp.]
MKKRLFSIFVAMGMIISALSIESDFVPATTAYAEKEASSGVIIDDEYLIPDGLGYFTYYVVVATNNTGSDIAISADFLAKDKTGVVLRRVNDYSDAVKNGQQFILYGQFSQESIRKAASFEYDYTIAPTDKCAYSQVSVNAQKNGHLVELSATNYSKYDIQGVGVRTIFLKNGKPIAFDTVNIADLGTTFRSGSTNYQVVGMNVSDYDDVVVTYTSVSNIPLPSDT